MIENIEIIGVISEYMILKCCKEEKMNKQMILFYYLFLYLIRFINKKPK